MIDSLKFWIAHELVNVAEFVGIVVAALVGVWWVTRK